MATASALARFATVWASWGLGGPGGARTGGMSGTVSRIQYSGGNVAFAFAFNTADSIGAKPSGYGPFATRRAEEFSHDPLYRCNPRLLPIALESISEAALPSVLGRPFEPPPGWRGYPLEASTPGASPVRPGDPVARTDQGVSKAG